MEGCSYSKPGRVLNKNRLSRLWGLHSLELHLNVCHSFHYYLSRYAHIQHMIANKRSVMYELEKDVESVHIDIDLH